MQKLPIGIQTFSEIREDNYLYIDKTKIALELITQSKNVFLSRPRRFGKSLFLDTLHNIFAANKVLFKGLYIYDHYHWEIPYPVIKISFGSGVLHSGFELERHLLYQLKLNFQDLQLECDTDQGAAILFQMLIKAAQEKYLQKVVILIDEYDKPLLDNITDIEIARDMQDGLRNFYSVMKDNDQYLRFVFLTGVSKFSKVSIFSGLNNIEDISLNPRYGNICGYTQEDINSSFKEYLPGVDLEKLKTWYNGYNFLGDYVYNPYDILLFIRNDFLYKNYWIETGTPNFLIQLLKLGNYFIPQLENLVTDERLLNSFDIENLRLETVLYQAGYLTIKSHAINFDDTIRYTLTVPNKEVQMSLNLTIIDYLCKDEALNQTRENIYRALNQAQLESLETTLISLFASIPYNNYVNNTIAHFEGYYASVLYAYLSSLGIDIIAEDVTNRGRIDLTLKLEKVIYILEFKVGSDNALAQIKQRNYQQKYSGDARDIYLMGINFDEDRKNISQFEWERMN